MSCQGTSPMAYCERRITTWSSAAMPSCPATSWPAGAVSTTSLTISDSSADGLTTGSPADAWASVGGALILDSAR